MKKFLIIFIILLLFIGVNIFSTSFGNEEIIDNKEISETTTDKIRNSDSKIIKTPFRIKFR